MLIGSKDLVKIVATGRGYAGFVYTPPSTPPLRTFCILLFNFNALIM